MYYDELIFVHHKNTLKILNFWSKLLQFHCLTLKNCTQFFKEYFCHNFKISF